MSEGLELYRSVGFYNPDEDFEHVVDCPECQSMELDVISRPTSQELPMKWRLKCSKCHAETTFTAEHHQLQLVETRWETYEI